jgi:hypothetical protein
MAGSTSMRHPIRRGIVLRRGGQGLRACVAFAIMLLAIANKASAADSAVVNPIRTNLTIVSSLIDRRQFDEKLLESDMSRVQMVTEESRLIAYFLDSPPDNIHISTLPETAREIVVAHVHMLGASLYMVGRDQSGRPPSSRPSRNLYFAELKILDVRSGDATVGARFGVEFGAPNPSRSRICRPQTPSQLGRDYFVVMYIDEQGQRRLAGFPISEAQYLEWEDEVRGIGQSSETPNHRIQFDPETLGHDGRVQLTTTARSPTTYFPQQALDSIDATILPKGARDIVVARVHVLGRPFWIAGRDRSPAARAKYVLSAELKILEVRRGEVAIGTRLMVSFGSFGSSDSFTYPHTPDQLRRDYFVVMYVDLDGHRCLAGVPISETSYQEWDTEVRKFERLRGGLGTPR